MYIINITLKIDNMYIYLIHLVYAIVNNKSGQLLIFKHL
jgi:hypothetical protein